MDHDDRFDDQVRDAYHRPIAGEQQARERAIARLRSEPSPSSRAAWWVDPDGLRMRPVLAAASLLVVLGIGVWAGASWMAPRDREPTPVPVVTRAGEATTVTFAFQAPGASRVSLVGDFNEWDPEATPLTHASGDTWTARVPLEHGLHAYAFVIDGRDWAPDPSAPLAPIATFGRRNSLLVVGEDEPL